MRGPRNPRLDALRVWWGVGVGAVLSGWVWVWVWVWALQRTARESRGESCAHAFAKEVLLPLGMGMEDEDGAASTRPSYQFNLIPSHAHAHARTIQPRNRLIGLRAALAKQNKAKQEKFHKIKNPHVVSAPRPNARCSLADGTTHQKLTLTCIPPSTHPPIHPQASRRAGSRKARFRICGRGASELRRARPAHAIGYLSAYL